MHLIRRRRQRRHAIDVLFVLREDVAVVALPVTDDCRRVGEAAGWGGELSDSERIGACDKPPVDAFTALCLIPA